MNRINRLLLLGLIFLLSNTLFGQKLKEESVPDAVRQSFEFEYPDSRPSAWYKENIIYIAEFKEEKISAKAHFTANGNWVKTIYPVPKSELPSKLTEFVRANYINYSYVLTQLQNTPDLAMHYYIEIRPEDRGKPNSYLTFDTYGNLLGRQDPEGMEDVIISTKEHIDPLLASNVPYIDRLGRQRMHPPADLHEGAIHQSDAPPAAVKEFNKRVQRAENVSWFKVDTFYVARCIAREQKNEVYLTSEGKWYKTYTQLEQRAVSGNMLKHLNTYYKGWKFSEAIKESRADKEDKTIVGILEKGNAKQKLVTFVLFDKTGKLDRSYDPDYTLDGEYDASQQDTDLDKYYKKMDMSMERNPHQGIPDNVVATFKIRYPRVTSLEWRRDAEGNYQADFVGGKGKEIFIVNPSGRALQVQTTASVSLVPEFIRNYLNVNFAGSTIKEFYNVKDLVDNTDLFKIIFNQKGSTENETIWFSSDGSLLDY